MSPSDHCFVSGCGRSVALRCHRPRVQALIAELDKRIVDLLWIALCGETQFIEQFLHVNLKSFVVCVEGRGVLGFGCPLAAYKQIRSGEWRLEHLCELPPPGRPGRAVPAGVIKYYAFVPGVLRTKVGSTIAIYSDDVVEHTIADDAQGGWTSQRQRGKSSLAISFPSSPGEFNFHCSIHPAMKGKVIVKP